MRAAQIDSYGDKSVVHVTQDAPKPAIGTGQALVEVYAAGINPFDWKVREGMARGMAELDFPATLGGDFAGRIAEVGEGVTNVQIGDEVYGQANALGAHGSYAEFTPVKATSLAAKPINLDFRQAAAVPLAAVSAYQAMAETLQLQPGQKILIHGGAGGIGTFAIQLAKHLGAYVATTAAGNDTEYVKELGTDKVIDYQSQDFSTLLEGYDAVYDTIGGETYTKSFQVLKPGGTIVSMLEEPDEALAKQFSVAATVQFTQVTTERLNQITDLIENGALTVHVDRTFPLDQAGEALDYLHAGKHRGKVVLAIK